MRILGIYKILNKTTGKFYIGKSANSIAHRWNVHRFLLRKGKHKNIYLQNAWNKYGECDFEFIILEVCIKENITEREQYWMDLTGCYDRELGYNINPNAETSVGKKFRQETKDKISAANKGNKWSEEAKAKITGRMLSKEHIEKVIETKRKNGTLSSLHLVKSLKGNSRRREKEKWPHAWGCKCLCLECDKKKKDYQKTRASLKKAGLWKTRELSYNRKKYVSM